ncbi:MAG: hypothetical protein ACUVTM_02830 [Candidatus Bathyarchaeia archaeon]
MKEENTGFRIAVSYLIPQVWTIIFAGILSVYLGVVGRNREVLTMFPETISGASLNSIVFVGFLSLTATLIYVMVRMGRVDIARHMIRFSLALSTFLLTSWYISKYLEATIQRYDAWLTSSSVSLPLAVILISTAYKGKGLMHAISLASIGSLTGTFLAFVIPPLSAVMLLGALILYDLISVYKGPIGRLAQSQALGDLKGAVFTIGDLTIGVGDLVFYSMLASMAFSNFGPFTYIMVSSGILFGAYVGIRLLESTYYLPGLPIPLTCGLTILFICSFITGW